MWTILILLTLAGCSSESTGITPEQLASKFYNAIINKDFNSAVLLYGSDMPAEAHMQELQELQSKLGDLQSYELRDTIVNTVFSGTRYIYTYRLQYASTAVTELLIMFKSVRGEPLHIEVRNYKIRHPVTRDDENTS